MQHGGKYRQNTTTANAFSATRLNCDEAVDDNASAIYTTQTDL
jgi:hypothetical protein